MPTTATTPGPVPFRGTRAYLDGLLARLLDDPAGYARYLLLSEEWRERLADGYGALGEAARYRRLSVAAATDAVAGYERLAGVRPADSPWAGWRLGEHLDALRAAAERAPGWAELAARAPWVVAWCDGVRRALADEPAARVLAADLSELEYRLEELASGRSMGWMNVQNQVGHHLHAMGRPLPREFF